jgi:DNA adenine methylase
MGYPGGKEQAGVPQWIINQLPPHRTYIEPFAGGAAVFRWKRRSLLSILNEIDPRQAASLFMAWGSTDPGVNVTCCDASGVIARYGEEPSALIYVDPPYLLNVRSAHRLIYAYEFEKQDDHAGLLELLSSLKAMVAISGYRSSLYDAMLSGWRRIERQVTTRGGGQALECLWMNYPEPVALHDCRYLGDNFRERERIRRRRSRWLAMLDGMNRKEALAMASVIAEWQDATTP